MEKQKRTKKVRVNYIESFGTQDGPGIRMVIFVQGCKMRCLYCQNPDTLSFKGGQEMTWQELLEKTLRQKEYFGTRGGVTISGGEPLLQARALLPFFKALKELGISTALDTNGFVWNDDVAELIDYTDYVLLDIKHIDPRKHKALTKVNLEPVLTFSQRMKELKKRLWVRYVLVPTWNDSDIYLRQWAQFVATLPNAERIEVLPYHTLGVPKYKELGMEYKLTDVPSPSKELKDRVRAIFTEEGLQNIIIK